MLDGTSSIEFSHSVPFKNYGACDMKGDKTYDTLNDFGMTMQIFNKNVADTAKQTSSNIQAENYSGNTLKIFPGSIDAYEIGDLKGFAVYEGVEGCGHTIYYFPLENNTKTFVVTKDMVQQLSGITSPDVKNQLLAVPGVINNDESKNIFENILKSVQFASVNTTANWKTYINSQSGFEVEYPSVLKVVEGGLNNERATIETEDYKINLTNGLIAAGYKIELFPTDAIVQPNNLFDCNKKQTNNYCLLADEASQLEDYQKGVVTTEPLSLDAYQGLKYEFISSDGKNNNIGIVLKKDSTYFVALIAYKDYKI